MSRNRDWRRSQYRRILEKRKDYYGGWMKNNPRLGMLASTAKLCSCYGCSRNWARRHMGQVTRQEELAELLEHEQLQELE
jgi:hypothetical protein